MHTNVNVQSRADHRLINMVSYRYSAIAMIVLGIGSMV